MFTAQKIGRSEINLLNSLDTGEKLTLQKQSIVSS